MTLDTGSDLDGDDYVGQLFVKPVRIKVKGQSTEYYKVQFWTWDWNARPPGYGDYFFQIYCDGDDIVYDETTDVLTVTVENETAIGWVYYDMNNCDPCEPDCVLCPDFVPACDDLCDPDCRPYPCNEEITIEDVSFVLKKTSDLDGCPVVE